jgi:anti-sigma regulatory factor (Ser/Thr protein kinase)
MACSASFAEMFGFPKDRIEDLKTIVAEASINAMQHGNKGRPDARVVVIMNYKDNAINVSVLDEGDGITRLPPTPDIERIIKELDPPMGLGIFLIDQLADKVDDISFTPLTNTVIDGIEEIDKALDEVGDNLEPPLSEMLDAALSVLPSDLQPITDPLIDRLGEIIEAGPVEFIEQIKPLPEQVFNKISQYNPENLIGDKLNGPFNQALDFAEGFDPANLLAELEIKFEELKQRLRDNADPQQLLEPVVDLHRQTSVALAELNPSELIEPLDQKIQAIAQTITEQIQIDELLQPLTDIIAQINRQTDTFTKGIDLVRHLLAKLADLNDAPTQIDAWIDSLFDLIPDGTDASSLTLPIGAISDAIEQSKAAQLSTFIVDQWQVVSDQLNALQPASCMNELVVSFTGISGSALAELPDSAEKTQLQNWLETIDLTAPEMTQILNQANGLHRALIGTLADFEALWSDWDQRFHRAGGALDNINLPGADFSAIKTLLREAVDRQLATPLKSVLGKLDAIQAMVGSLLDVFETLVQAIQTRVDDLLSTPEAILALGEALQAVVDTIGAINLDFLQDSIDAVFTEVRDKFNELNPVNVQQALGDAFDQTLDALSFNQIIPENSLDNLAQTFADTLAKLRTLDPSEVLVAPLQSIFDEQIQPLIDSVDITPLLEALVDRLENLDEELKDEMVRVNTAYQELLRQAPSAGDGASVGF